MLYFISDPRTGYEGWNFLSVASLRGTVESVFAMGAEFGLPQWVFGMSTYARFY
jgi:hypothetical protein